MDLFDYIYQTRSPLTPIKDKNYDKVIIIWKDFINCLSDEDKQLFTEIISKCYFKYQESIKAKANSDFELNTGLFMSILIDQQIQMDKLIKRTDNSL